MFEKISSKIEDITKRRSETLALLNTFEGQRPINRTQIAILSAAMSDGSFRRGEIAIAHFGDKEILMNGQHQLRSSIETGQTFCAALDRYRVQNEQDLWRLFATFDVHKPRTAGDVMRAAKPLLSNELLRSVPLRVLSTCGSALVYLGEGTKPTFGTTVAARSLRAELVDKFSEDVLFVAKWSDHIPMLKTGVVVAMIVTHRKNPDAVAEFWDRVIVGDNLQKGSPQFQLRRTIVEGLRSTKQLAGGSRTLIAIYGTCIHWWNAYISGQPRKLVRTSRIDKELPEALASRSNGRLVTV